MKRASSLLASLAVLLPFTALAAGESPSHNSGLSPRQRALIQRSNGVYSLHEAAQAGDVSALARRLRAGDNPNQKDELGNTPLHLAARGKSLKLLRVLLNAGADCRSRNYQGQTALQLCRHEKLRQVLQEADTRRARELEAFALLKKGDAAALRALLGKGVSPNALSEDGNSCLLLVAVENGSREALLAVLEARPNIRAVTRQSHHGPLHLAARRGDTDLMRLLMRAGADPMQQAGNGAYPLHEAIYHGKLEATRFLLPSYRKLNYNPDGGRNGYPINTAIKYGGADFLKLFLDAHVKLDDERFGDNAPLFTAAKCSDENSIRLLMEAGVDPTRRDSRGKTAADYAPATLAPLMR